MRSRAGCSSSTRKMRKGAAALIGRGLRYAAARTPGIVLGDARRYGITIAIS